MIKRLSKWAQEDLDNGKLASSEVLFWIVGIGVSISLTLLVTSLIHPAFISPCDSLPSFDCISKATADFKVLTLPLTATVTIAGFWALIFRSHQTSEQIKTSQRQTQLTIDNNTFNNYIAHKKAFIEVLVEIETQYKCEITSKSYIYESLFPANSPTNISFNSDVNAFKQLEKRYENVLKKLSPIASEIVKIDPRIDEGMPLQESDIQTFIYINNNMQVLLKDLETLHIKAINFSEVKYDDFDESGHHTAITKVPTDLKILIQVVSTMHGRLARFSNMQDCKSIYPSPDMINAIDTYNLSGRVVSTNRLIP